MYGRTASGGTGGAGRPGRGGGTDELVVTASVPATTVPGAAVGVSVSDTSSLTPAAM